MRGLGGISAVAAGLIYAALVQRISRPAATVLGLTLLGAFSAVGTVSEWPMLATFCLGIGAATAILNPTLQSGAAACFATPAEQGRAATMVTATTTLTAVLAAPVLGALSLLVGWRGLLWTVAALSLTAAAAAVLAGTSSRSTARVGAGGRRGASDGMDAPAAPRPGRLPLATVLRNRGAAALIGISLLRTAGFMGALAVVAAVYAERHGLTGAGFTLVWTVSGAPFFAGNWFSGRLLSVRDADAALMAGGIVASLAGVALVFAASPFALMVTGTAVLAVGHAMIAAGVTTGLARLADPARSAALAVNGVAQAAGTVAGAALAGAGYALAGWPGVAWALAAVTVPCAALLVMTRAGRN